MDPLFSFLLGGGGFGGGFHRRGGGGRKKAKKQPKENWFQRLTVAQNKDLCKAAKLRHGGSKKELIDRLMEDPQTSKFGHEGKYIGINVEMLKGMCRDRNLQVTGTKYDLVLRILHCDNSSTPEGATLKRAATDVVSTVDAVSGEVVEKHVPKKRKKSAPSATKIYTRVEKKIEAVKQKKYQSHWGSKTHSSEVYDLVATILSNDVVRSEEDYLNKDPRFALSLAEAACTSLSDNFHIIQRPGYDDDGGWSTIDDKLRTIAESTKEILSMEERESFADWIEDLHNVADPYGLTMDTNLTTTAEYLRNTDEGGKSEEDEAEKEEIDERKPAAVPVPIASTKSAGEAIKGGADDLTKENTVNCSITSAAALP